MGTGWCGGGGGLKQKIEQFSDTFDGVSERGSGFDLDGVSARRSTFFGVRTPSSPWVREDGDRRTVHGGCCSVLWV